MQHSFTNCRLKQINTYENINKLYEETKLILMKELGHKHYSDQLEQCLLNLVERLRQADLTINFNANRWFKKENIYNTYSQMYERNQLEWPDGPDQQ